MLFDRYSYIYIYIYICTHITSIHIYSIHGVKLFNPTILGHAHLPSFVPRSPWRRRAAPPIRPCPAGILSFCIDFPQTHLSIQCSSCLFLCIYIYIHYCMYIYTYILYCIYSLYILCIYIYINHYNELY